MFLFLSSPLHHRSQELHLFFFAALLAYDLFDCVGHCLVKFCNYGIEISLFDNDAKRPPTVVWKAPTTITGSSVSRSNLKV